MVFDTTWCPNQDINPILWCIHFVLHREFHQKQATASLFVMSLKSLLSFVDARTSTSGAQPLFWSYSSPEVSQQRDSKGECLSSSLSMPVQSNPSPCRYGETSLLVQGNRKVNPQALRTVVVSSDMGKLEKALSFCSTVISCSNSLFS